MVNRERTRRRLYLTRANARSDVFDYIELFYNRKRGEPVGAIVLSAKTTLRERWKQVRREKFDCDVYLATVDDRVAAHVIAALQHEGIQLVVPESLKRSDASCYPKNSNVISFDRFFSIEIGERRPMLLGHL